MRERIAELAAFVNRAGRLGCDEERNTEGKGVQQEVRQQALLVL
jgi:hypothetical protein